MGLTPHDLVSRPTQHLQLGDDASQFLGSLAHAWGFAPEMLARQPLSELAKFLEIPPPRAPWFNTGRSITLGASAVRSLITDFMIPSGFYGVLRYIACETAVGDDAPNVTFSLEINGQGVAGFAAIIGPIAPSIYLPMPILKGLMPGENIRWVATNATATAIANVRARLTGWYWPAGRRPR